MRHDSISLSNTVLECSEHGEQKSAIVMLKNSDVMCCTECWNDGIRKPLNQTNIWKIPTIRISEIKSRRFNIIESQSVKPKKRGFEFL